MFLPSCDVLASEQQSLVDAIDKLDRQLANKGSRRELRIAPLAYVINEDEDVVHNLVARLVTLGALEEEQRFCCPDQHQLFTSDDLRDAHENAKMLRCPQCRRVLSDDVLTTVSVFNVLEEPRYPGDHASADVRRVLVVSANPTLDILTLQEEMRNIQKKLTLEKSLVEVLLDFRPAATVDDLRGALLQNPPSVVHFAGHGGRGGLIFSDESGNAHAVRGKALATLFAMFNERIRCVVMNACYSATQLGLEAIPRHRPPAFYWSSRPIGLRTRLPTSTCGE